MSAAALTAMSGNARAQALNERLAAAQAALRLQNEMVDSLAARGAQRDPRGAALLDQVQRRAAELRGQITELRAMGARA